MKPNKLTFTVSKYGPYEVLTEACARRAHEMTRVAIIEAWNAATGQHADPHDCCATTGELAADLIRRGLLCKV